MLVPIVMQMSMGWAGSEPPLHSNVIGKLVKLLYLEPLRGLQAHRFFGEERRKHDLSGGGWGMLG